eukprot:g4413.t1
MSSVAGLTPEGVRFINVDEGSVHVKTFFYLKEATPKKCGGRPPRITFQVGGQLKMHPTIEFADHLSQAGDQTVATKRESQESNRERRDASRPCC